MRSWPLTGIVWLLVLLVAVTTPLGIGDRAHRDQLLDPIFPHVHPGHRHGASATAGHSHDPSPSARPAALNWPALDRGAAAASDATAGLGLIPVPAAGSIALHIDQGLRQWRPDRPRPLDWIASPNVPPPRVAQHPTHRVSLAG